MRIRLNMQHLNYLSIVYYKYIFQSQENMAVFEQSDLRGITPSFFPEIGSFEHLDISQPIQVQCWI
jgi:hypothetical protein